MIHFSCDQCGKELLADINRRYTVKIEVFAANATGPLSDDDLADDHLESLSQLLSDLESSGGHPDLPPDYKQIRLDLCPECHKKFLRDPLNKDAVKFDFSEN